MRRLPPHGFSSGVPPSRSHVIARSFASSSGRPATSAPRLAASFALGIAVGAVGAYAYARRALVDDRENTPTERSIEREASSEVELVEHEALKHGWPLDSSSVIHSKSSYAHAFDGRTRNPRWVMEKISRDTISGPGSRKRSDFREDEDVSWKHRSRLEDYRGSGYDRGHLVAAADQKGSQEDMDATFALSNISPQVGDGFNRDYWAKLEQFVRDVASADGTKAAFVATGPLFLASRRDTSTSEAFERQDTRAVQRVGQGAPKPTAWEMRHPMLGEPPALMAVPTHFFKVVFVEGSDSRVSCAAFVLPNAPIPRDVSLRRFVVPLTDLEIVSGLEFFKRGLTGHDRAKYERDEQTFLTTTSKQLPGAGKIPSLPASSADEARLRRAEGSTSADAAVVKRWADVRHLCQVTACEVKPGK